MSDRNYESDNCPVWEVVVFWITLAFMIFAMSRYSIINHNADVELEKFKLTHEKNK